MSTELESAHPRVGGENGPNQPGNCFSAGSSPRGRGKQTLPALVAGLGRLIPAWAGKTHHKALRRRGGGAHPRVGGENGRTITGYRRRYGSSPRGRGKPRRGSSSVWRAGLIPAWAGKT